MLVDLADLIAQGLEPSQRQLLSKIRQWTQDFLDPIDLAMLVNESSRDFLSDVHFSMETPAISCEWPRHERSNAAPSE